MRIIMAALIAAASSSAVAQTGPWKKIPVPEWSAVGMMENGSELRRHGIVTGWFRFVDAPGRAVAEESEDGEVRRMVAAGSHLDMRASIDCPRRRFRVEGNRIVLKDGTVSQEREVHPDLKAWVPLGGRTRPAAIHQAVCGRKKGR